MLGIRHTLSRPVAATAIVAPFASSAFMDRLINTQGKPLVTVRPNVAKLLANARVVCNAIGDGFLLT